jgi:hypothetical protein
MAAHRRLVDRPAAGARDGDEPAEQQGDAGGQHDLGSQRKPR